MSRRSPAAGARPIARKLSRKPGVDWEQVEAHYRAGVLSVLALSKLNGVSRTAVVKRAAKEKWQRNLTGKVRDLAEAKLTETVTQDIADAGAVSADGQSTPPQVSGPVSTMVSTDTSTEAEAARQAHLDAIVSTTAQAMVSIVRGHRAQLIRQGALALRLEQKLEDFLGAVPQQGVMGLPQISDATGVLEALVRIRTRLIPLERQAFNLDPRKAENPEKGLGNDDDGAATAAGEIRSFLEELAATKTGGGDAPAAVAEDGPPGADHPQG